MPNSVIYQYYTASKVCVHRKKCYRKSSHWLRQEEAEQTADSLVNRVSHVQLKGKIGEENCPEEDGGDCPAGGHYGQ